MMIWTPQGADTKRYALRLTLIAAVLVAVAAGAWFLSDNTAQSAAPTPVKCGCIPENGLEFKTWQAGPERVIRIPERRPMKTFITNQQTYCKVYAEVGAINPEDADILPIRWTWSASMTHGFNLLPTGWFAGSWIKGRFILNSAGSGDNHKPQDCKGNGRGNTPMRINLTLEVLYECTSLCGRCRLYPVCPMRKVSRTYTANLVLTQDPIDEIRQEYVDHDDHPEHEALSVPSRSDFKAKDSLYAPKSDPPNWMVDRGLEYYRKHWAEQCTFVLRDNLVELRGLSQEEADKYVIKAINLPINSGYRNPEHNWEHVLAQGYTPSWGSRHQYGDALDVSAAYVDMDGDGERGTPADKRLMEEASYNSRQALGVTGYSYYKGHVHSDWRP